jgi:hypothetical protein
MVVLLGTAWHIPRMCDSFQGVAQLHLAWQITGCSDLTSAMSSLEKIAQTEHSGQPRHYDLLFREQSNRVLGFSPDPRRWDSLAREIPVPPLMGGAPGYHKYPGK